MKGRNAPGEWTLAWAIRLLPAARLEWGQAMQAELAGIEGVSERRRFAAGCLAAAARRPRAAAVLAWDLLMAGTVVAALRWAAGIGYAPLRIEAMVVVVLAAGLSLLTGRVANGWAPRLLRLGGYALIAAEGALLLRSFGAINPADLARRTHNGSPPLAIALMLYLVAIAALTANRSRIGRQVLLTGALSAAITGLLFSLPMTFGPPLVGPGWVMLAGATAACAALLLVGLRTDDAWQGLVAGLCAFILVMLLFAALAEDVLQFMPVTWVPDTSPPNVPATDRLANNIVGAEDPYRLLLGLGALVALALIAIIVSARWHRLADTTRIPDHAATPTTEAGT